MNSDVPRERPSASPYRRPAPHHEPPTRLPKIPATKSAMISSGQTDTNQERHVSFCTQNGDEPSDPGRVDDKLLENVLLPKEPSSSGADRESRVAEDACGEVIQEDPDAAADVMRMCSGNQSTSDTATLTRDSSASRKSTSSRQSYGTQGRRWTPFRDRRVSPVPRQSSCSRGSKFSFASKRLSAKPKVGGLRVPGQIEEDDEDRPRSANRLRAEVSILRDMLHESRGRSGAIRPSRFSGEWVVPDEEGNLPEPGRKVRTLLERLDELNHEVHIAKRRRCKTEIVGVIILVSYLLCGMIFYSQYEGWTWQFSLYFCVVVATTVGFGDQDPIDTVGGRLFTCCFVFFGVALVLGLGTYLVLQLIADRRNRVLAQQREMRRKQRDGGQTTSTLQHSDGILQSALTQAESTTTFLKSMVMPFVLMLASWTVWILFFMFCEGEDLDFVEALYFTIISGTTVGFGDISPTTEEGQWFASVWLIILVVLTTTFLGRLAEGLIPQPDDFRLNNVMLEGPNAVLQLCDTDGDGDVEYYEWLECLCLATGKVDTEFIRTAREHFDCLEGTGDGRITQQDVDIQDELYKRWKVEQDGGGELVAHNPLVHAMGMAWLAITKANKKQANSVAPQMSTTSSQRSFMSSRSLNLPSRQKKRVVTDSTGPPPEVPTISGDGMPFAPPTITEETTA